MMEQEEKNLLREETNDEIFAAAKECGLTERQLEFALLYLETYNPKMSYWRVYGGGKATASARAASALKTQSMQKFIKKAKEIMQINYDINPTKYIEFLLKAANADITDYLSFSEEEIEVRNKDGEIMLDLDTGEPIKKKISKIRLKNSDEVDGALISRVSQGREGIKIELIDKIKCWEKLKDYFGWELNKKSDTTSTNNIIEAINKSAKSVWDEKDIDKDLEETLKK